MRGLTPGMHARGAAPRRGCTSHRRPASPSSTTGGGNQLPLVDRDGASLRRHDPQSRNRNAACSGNGGGDPASWGAGAERARTIAGAAVCDLRRQAASLEQAANIKIQRGNSLNSSATGKHDVVRASCATRRPGHASCAHRNGVRHECELAPLDLACRAEPASATPVALPLRWTRRGGGRIVVTRMSHECPDQRPVVRAHVNRKNEMARRSPTGPRSICQERQGGERRQISFHAKVFARTRGAGVDKCSMPQRNTSVRAVGRASQENRDHRGTASRRVMARG